MDGREIGVLLVAGRETSGVVTGLELRRLLSLISLWTWTFSLSNSSPRSLELPTKQHRINVGCTSLHILFIIIIWGLGLGVGGLLLKILINISCRMQKHIIK